jgi:uncharacterized repeat protein (TIGR03803 family)
MDQAGILYGTSYCNGSYLWGEVFKLKQLPGGDWSTYPVYEFRGAPDDGGYPLGNLVIDANGNLYGTGSIGGAHGKGVIFEITP